MKGMEHPVIDGKIHTFNQAVAEKEFDGIAKFFESWHRDRADIKGKFRARMSAREFSKHLNFPRVGLGAGTRTRY